MGPVGDSYGTSWDEKGHGNIVQIFVSHDDRIRSIQFQYVESKNLLLSKKCGSYNGLRFDTVKLDFPREYITWIRGYVTFSYSITRICSLTFGTNYREYGPFGRSSKNDTEFRFGLGNDRQFGGFHGSADSDCVRSIGVYLKPIMNLDYKDEGTEDHKPTEGVKREMLH